MEKKIEQLLELLTDIVNVDNMSWAEKCDLVKSEAAKNEDYRTSLGEFISWFE